jgi:hypothetical protein
MKRVFALILAALGQFCAAQVAVTPVSLPHQTFFDGSGSPCALCKLYSYNAGTTTPTPTYSDSSGGPQNPNPIILDAGGAANIWVATSVSYKFVLKDSLGATIWTVDNVSGGGGGSVPCSTPYAIQFANSTHTALACDQYIKVNTSSHAIEVGGSITGPAFTMRNLSTITSSWTFDISTPLTALNSLSLIPLNRLASQSQDTVVMNAQGTTATPTAISLPVGCTSGLNYNTLTHTWSCLPTTTPVSSISPIAADTIVMNASGGSAAPTAVAMPTGCVVAVKYDTSTHTWSCYNPPATDYYWTETGCAIGVGQPNHCDFTAHLPGPMPDVNYQVFCTHNILGDTPATACNLAQAVLPTASGGGMVIRLGQYQQNGTIGTTQGPVYLHAHHN